MAEQINLRNSAADTISYFGLNWASVTDGPGTRVVVFFQGCGLNCAWCHSPHSQPGKSPLLFFETLCSHCKRCVEVCPNGVHRFVENKRHRVERGTCQSCRRCIEACPRSSEYQNGHGALVLPTRTETVDCLFEKIKSQLDLLKRVTFSGGEPLQQARGLARIAETCKLFGTHTAVETSGIVPVEDIELVRPYVDTWLVGMRVLVDLDTRRIREFERRMHNTLTCLRNSNADEIIARIAVIPEYTTQPVYLESVKNLLRTYNVTKLEVLMQNPETAHFYAAMGAAPRVHFENSVAVKYHQFVKDYFSQ